MSAKAKMLRHGVVGCFVSSSFLGDVRDIVQKVLSNLLLLIGKKVLE